MMGSTHQRRAEAKRIPTDTGNLKQGRNLLSSNHIFSVHSSKNSAMVVNFYGKMPGVLYPEEVRTISMHAELCEISSTLQLIMSRTIQLEISASSP